MILFPPDQARADYLENLDRRIRAAEGLGRSMTDRVDAWLKAQREDLVFITLKHSGRGAYRCTLMRARRRAVANLSDTMGENEFGAALAEAVAQLPPPMENSFLAGDVEADPEVLFGNTVDKFKPEEEIEP